ncbi:MAG: hypothetical protein ACTTGJ_00515 [Clostridium sp.]
MKIVKEIGVIFVVAVIMIITLGIILYSKFPSQKNIPQIRTYNSNQQYNKIMNENVEENKPTVKKYYLDNEGLETIEQKVNLKKGRSNPFSDSQDINGRRSKQNNSGTINNGQNDSLTEPSKNNTNTSGTNTNTNTNANANNNSTEEGRILNRNNKDK